ncbi:flagellar biosynthesis anti-sigma factor FlgM [Anoxybacter fermentans]|uniref:Negative regulator of flagellin synthesis n=1 Tax=Anoxybacter fermentans TaxID=1323375 RepID=A0A3Q9HR81_9FIRM|nr:flagellar biosynthesis anti-sigma factor FlgM [Anoxybacter fermentans]AZR73904.1 flagellar biosynthesis anti-sigma factor FlgM [Anoxybacter fermentans]
MKISGSRLQQIGKMYQKNSFQKLGGSNSVREDKVNLSREAKELKRIYEVLAKTPDIRTEKVNQLKRVIQQGTYEIKGEMIAEKMIEGYFIDKIVK